MYIRRPSKAKRIRRTMMMQVMRGKKKKFPFDDGQTSSVVTVKLPPSFNPVVYLVLVATVYDVAI